MARSRTSSWTDTTEVSASGVAAILQAVEIDLDPGSDTEMYLQLFNVAAPTPGTTAPNMVLMIPPTTVHNRKRLKYVFGGGIVFDTALTYFASTTHDGATAPTGDDIPTVTVYYSPLTD